MKIKIGCLLFSLFIMVFILSSCTKSVPLKNEESSSESSNVNSEHSHNDTDQPKTIGTAITDVVIAQGNILIKNKDFTVKLVMRYGKHFTGEEVALIGSTGDETYIGSCELQVWQDKMIYDICAVPGDVGVDTLYSEIGFKIEFDDYNNDGNPDFAIGQSVGSAGNFYSLFTIDENSTIKMISMPYGIYASNGKSEYGYSTLFEKSDDGIIVQQYNQDVGEYMNVHYVWEETSTGRFVLKSEDRNG